MLLRSLILAMASAALTAAAWAQSPQKTVHDIQLDSGITLADWLALPTQRSAEPTLEVGAQAASYVECALMPSVGLRALASRFPTTQAVFRIKNNGATAIAFVPLAVVADQWRDGCSNEPA